MQFIKKNYPIFLITLLCAVIIAIWFKDGKLLATGEEGLMLINPIRNIELYKYSWNEIGLGIAGPGSNVMIPFYNFELLILKSGVPIWLFQPAIFFFLMFVGACSIYYLSNELFKNLVEDSIKIKLALIASIFYILNPVSLLGVWYRFLLGFMFFYALAPLFFYLFVVGVKNKRKIFIIIVPLITLLFSFAFANPASILMLWFLPVIYSFSLSWPRTPKGETRFNRYPLIYFGLMFIFWVLINIWWIFPYIELSKIAFGSEISPIHAVNTLKANSQDFTLDNVIRLIHGGFLYKNEAFGSIYKNPIFIVISWLIPIITIYGLLKLRRSQIKLFFALSLILLLFVAKGTSFPLGQVFLWFFSHISILQVFRNPLEKFGMLMPTIYAPLFSFGLVYLLNKTQDFKKRLFLSTLSLTFLVIFHWPFFTGALVSFRGRDIKVEVPPSFRSANQAIEKNNHVILSIPVMGGASGFYKWKHGFKGVDASPYLFNYPVVNIFYDANSFYGQMLIGFSNGALNNLIGLAQLFSADLVVYRKDTDVSAFGYNLDALERSKKMIDDTNLSKIFDSYEFSLWSLPKEKQVPIIYTPRTIRLGDSPAELISLLEEDRFDPRTETFICIMQEKCKPYKKLADQSVNEIKTIPEKVEFIKVSPVNYEIKVYNSQGMFILVFNNSYHPGWRASIEGKPIDEDSHIVANGYANGFLIDKVGSFNISLKFAPEEKIVSSYKVSLAALLFGVIMLLGSWILSLFKHD